MNKIITQKKRTEIAVKVAEAVNNDAPSEYTIKNILNYSKALCIKKSETIRNIELILN